MKIAYRSDMNDQEHAEWFKQQALNYPGATEFFTKEETRKFLLSRKSYLILNRKRHRDVKVRYKRKWLTLGRCDHCHQVHSAIGSSSSDAFYVNPLKFYADRAWGAVIINNFFYVIDAGSDG